MLKLQYNTVYVYSTYKVSQNYLVLLCIERNIEGRVVEIAKLQEVFSEKVLEQVSYSIL